MPLKRALGFAALTFYGVGIILGAGIYSVLGAAAARSGSALWLSFAIASAVAAVTALSYSELATAYPAAGAEFTYVRRALPRWPEIGSSVGLLVAASGAASAATVAIAFAGYWRTFLDVPGAVVAWGLLAAATLVNVVGVRESGWVNAAFTLVEVGGLVLFVGLGVSSDRFGAAFVATTADVGVVSGAALVFYSFLGFENIANLSEEAKAPSRDIPRAIFASLGIATALYVLVALAALALVPAAELGVTQAPLADAARSRSSAVAGALGGIALFATANTALVSMLVASRVVFGMAREKELPSALARVLPRRKTPWVATLAVGAVSAALVPFGEIAILASLSSFASLVAFAAIHVALIVLRYRDPRRARPFRVRGTVGRFAVLPAIGAVITVAVATQLDRTALVTGLATVAALAIYSVWKRKRWRPTATSTSNASVRGPSLAAESADPRAR
jgi:amino acid transporter